MTNVDPRAPRFGQAITATLALGGLLLREPLIVSLLAGLLVVPVASRWRVDPYGTLWRRGVRRVIGPPRETESAIPHRFARFVGACVTAPAAVLLILGGITGVAPLMWLGYALVAVVGALATLGATTGFCLGCRLYRSVGRVQRLGLLESPRP